MRKNDRWANYQSARVMRIDTYIEKCQSGEIKPGLSPGGVADRLGLTPEAVTHAARRGRIRPIVVLDQAGFVTIIDIPDEEVERYRKDSRGRPGPKSKGTAA